jgi:hypothetical protein
MHCGVALTNREIEERLDRQRNTRKFMTREGMCNIPNFGFNFENFYTHEIITFHPLHMHSSII